MENNIQYTISTTTSKHYIHGMTDAEVFIRMIGKDGCKETPWFQLSHYFYKDFQLGKTDIFTVTTTDVGIPDVISLKINKARDKFGWFCDTVTVENEYSDKVTFRVYDVVLNEVTVRKGNASLPQNDRSPLLRDIRRMERDQIKVTYQWHLIPSVNHVGWGLPRYCNADDYDHLPLMFQEDDTHFNMFMGLRNITFYNLLMEHGKSILFGNAFRTFKDYTRIFNHPSVPSEMPLFYERWKKDEEFGRQILSGINPLVIKRCDTIPKQLNKAVSTTLGGTEAIISLLKAKKIYVVNYRGMLDGVKRNTNRNNQPLYCCDPVCLLQVGEDKELRPIAIQLEDGGPVFTPNDSELDWLLAKIYFRNADSNIHEYFYHLMQTHIVMEPVCIGMFRSLPRSHPVYKLLRPHLHTVSAINTLGRAFLIGPEAAANYSMSANGLDMTRAAFRKFTFGDLIIPQVIKNNGTDDPDALPCYHYRSDANRLWKAIELYVSKIINYFYKDDKDVCEDFELTEFIRTVAEDGIGWSGNGTKGFPIKISKISDLVEYITVVIFTCTCQHAATNFGQFETYKFIPNSPGGLRLPPHKKGEATMQRILESLPDTTMSCLQIGIAFTLSSFSPNEVFLGEFPIQLFSDSNVLKIQKEFCEDLRQISHVINERNRCLSIPYTFLLPERIPISIAI